ncbi:UDP-N-acetylmuramoyl-L-alanine--D-glutamate ligase [Tepidibacter hydrothermalis]|uniref:UDP-N-acetylmuramoylalanine--D-glutamate ligase n=1 Tax=Tepidibacter hydrothermalis TaxID=3036126 RepID=A0ABY8E8D8_9FIRM|nr:UDP-N-acetylmuramoyl-L-alanine--D-glutamate ligase [Tepidibacter hydrothermalis]WFD09153.1 UDP-N-acetylmuramoyl-L-alanine--D-glutamate ligase [Tepidibacter hydrothermalis]
MDLNSKNVLLVGLARTGISTIKKLYEKGAKVTVNDIKNEEKLKDILDDLKEYDIKYVLGKHIEDINNIDLTIVSPGVPLDLDFIKKIKSANIEVIGEVELSYRLSKSFFIGITGTNGKTTTTTLVGEIFKSANKDTYIVGNIGNPVIDTVDNTDEDSVLVTELSSFQLESIKEFRPRISAILNITPDHLNRHKTMQNYIDAKCRIFENQNENDFTVLNYDCETTRDLAKKCKSKIVYFSRKEILNEGVYVKDDIITINLNDKEIKLMSINEISIPGSHNLENALAAVSIAAVYGLDMDVVKQVLKTFGGVEHRLEFVRQINDVKFVNDSKGTNPDASIKALSSYENPIVLIAGGLDKKSDFTEFTKLFNEKVKHVILLGETSDIIKESAIKQGFNNCHKVENMEEAVQKAYKLASPNDVVLLSPACASWDMYESYEVRGNHFKNEVFNL